MLYYVSAIVNNAPIGDFMMCNHAQVTENLPDKVSINLCWKAFNDLNEAKDFQNTVNESGIWAYPIW